MDKRKIRMLDEDGLWSYALKVLGGRAHSTGELREKLSIRAEHKLDVENTIGRLKDIGYLNDQRFAEGFAAARLGEEKFGKTRVIQELRKRHVAPALAEQTVQKVFQDVDERARIEEWIRRHYRTSPREGLFAEGKDLASAYRKLAKAGFQTGEIIPALKRFAKNPDLLDGFEPPVEEVE